MKRVTVRTWKELSKIGIPVSETDIIPPLGGLLRFTTDMNNLLPKDRKITIYLDIYCYGIWNPCKDKFFQIEPWMVIGFDNNEFC